jgi:hypothetical protein
MYEPPGTLYDIHAHTHCHICRDRPQQGWPILITTAEQINQNWVRGGGG